MHPFASDGGSLCPPMLDAGLPAHLRSANAFAADLERTTASTLHMSLSDEMPSTKAQAPAMLGMPFLRGAIALSPSVAARPVVTATSATATSTIHAVAPSPLTPSLGLWPDLSVGDLGSGLGSGLFAPDFGGFDGSPDMANNPQAAPQSGPSSTTDLDSDELEQLSPFYPADTASPIAMPGQASAHAAPSRHTSEIEPPLPDDSSYLFAPVAPPAPEPMAPRSYTEPTPHLLPSAPIYKPHHLSRGRTSLAGAIGSPFSAPSMSPVPSGPSTSPVLSGLSMSPTSGLSSPGGVLGRQIDSFSSIPWGDGWPSSGMAPSARHMGMEQPYSVSLGSSLHAIPPPALPPGPNRASVRPPATSGPSGLSMAFNPSATAFSPLPNASVTNSFSPSTTPAYPPTPTPFPAIYASGLPTAMDANPPPAFLPDSVAPQTLEQESPPVPGGMMSLMSRLDVNSSPFGQGFMPSSPSMSSSALSSGSAQSPLLAPSPLGRDGVNSTPLPPHLEEDFFGTSVPSITPREAAQSFTLTSAAVMDEPMARSLPPHIGATGTGSRRRVEVDPVTGIITRPTRGRAVPTNLEDMAHLGKLGKGGRVWACKVPGCSKMFRRSEHLNRHLRSIHSEARPFKCPFDGCNKFFSRRDNLNQHQRVHTLDKAARRRRSSTTSRGRLSPLADT